MPQSQLSTSQIIRRSLFLTWVIISAGILVILFIPFLISYDHLGNILPECESKVRYGRECAFCGMTASFYFISRGEFHQAIQANRGSIYLYSGFLANEFLILFVLLNMSRGYFRRSHALINLKGGD
jgi:hypothetical protein